MPEDRLYFEDRNGRAASIPKHFTDLAPIDPVIFMGRRACLFRIGDLLELCSLLEANGLANQIPCNPNFVACVKATMPPRRLKRNG